MFYVTLIKSHAVSWHWEREQKNSRSINAHSHRGLPRTSSICLMLPHRMIAAICGRQKKRYNFSVTRWEDKLWTFSHYTIITIYTFNTLHAVRLGRDQTSCSREWISSCGSSGLSLVWFISETCIFAMYKKKWESVHYYEYWIDEKRSMSITMPRTCKAPMFVISDDKCVSVIWYFVQHIVE